MLRISVTFDGKRDSYDYDCGTLELKKGIEVICQTDDGLRYGITKTDMNDCEEVDLPKIIRIATEKDRLQLEQIKIQQQKAFAKAKELISEHGLEMKLLSAEYVFDLTKLIFVFTADGRVDFRDLVRSMASTFKTRIELRQIGTRDESRIIGGIGPCGREICCKSYLKDFGKVSIKMAKDQGLPLNPNGISGCCGRLMCCLQYEQNDYIEALSQMPHLNSKVITPDGEGVVVFNNVLLNTVTVKFITEDGSYKTVDYAANEIKEKCEKKHE